jgi:glycosyltransferase involved in cell wall biosynthesis
MPSILKAIPHAKLLIVGECYDDWSDYQQIIDQYQLSNHVVVVNDYVPNEDVERYFSISDLVLLPYRSATQSGILNIAYGFQKPVVANQVGGFAEFIRNGETGLLVETCNAEAFANGVIEYHHQYRDVNIAAHLHKVRAANSFEDILIHVDEFLSKNSKHTAG